MSMHARDRRRTVVLCSHGIQDPLVSTLMLDYLFRMMEKDQEMEAMLVTEEEEIPVLPEALLARLTEARIRWSPLRYRLSGPQFLQKGLNLLRLFVRAHRFVRGARERVVVGFLSMAGCYAAILRAFGFTRCVCVNFEPHSRYMRDAGIWKAGSLRYRFMSRLERYQVRRADVVVVPTTAVEAFVRSTGSKAELHLQGVTIDVASSLGDPKAAAAYRAMWGIDDRKVVLFYAGKFNGLYCSEQEYVHFMLSSCQADERVRHVVVTFPAHAEALRAAPGFGAIAERIVLLDPVAPEVLKDMLPAGDLGVVAVPPTPSQVFRSPVKTALYWAAGLPILINKGVSDDWWIAEERGVGHVLDDLASAGPDLLRPIIATLGSSDAGVRERCVRAAYDLRGTERMVTILSGAIRMG